MFVNLWMPHRTKQGFVWHNGGNSTCIFSLQFLNEVSWLYKSIQMNSFRRRRTEEVGMCVFCHGLLALPPGSAIRLPCRPCVGLCCKKNKPWFSLTQHREMCQIQPQTSTSLHINGLKYWNNCKSHHLAGARCLISLFRTHSSWIGRVIKCKCDQ